jgi:hypothetical protein
MPARNRAPPDVDARRIENHPLYKTGIARVPKCAADEVPRCGSPSGAGSMCLR